MEKVTHLGEQYSNGYLLWINLLALDVRHQMSEFISFKYIQTKLDQIDLLWCDGILFRELLIRRENPLSVKERRESPLSVKERNHEYFWR